MILNVNDMLYALSYALDCVERDVVGVTMNHGKRVAFLTVMMGKEAGLSKEALLDLAGLSILHDNALTEYRREEIEMDGIISGHCISGEKNLAHMPFHTDTCGSILYHHENADGSGPFGRTEAETPLYAQLIHLADQLDVKWDLSNMTEEKLHGMLGWIRRRTGGWFSERCAELFERAVSPELLQNACLNQADELLHGILPGQTEEYSREQIKDIAALFAKIVDYKSAFTSRHSIGIAEKAERMACFYEYPQEKAVMLYFAGALHDIGKLVVDKEILEKPDRLSQEEYQHIQNHAYGTYRILHQIRGLEELTGWASHHHEKLNGSGYPFGKTAAELGREERLMACLDIYQALTEDRPYKNGFSHERTMEIMRKMAAENAIDAQIVEDIHGVFGKSGPEKGAEECGTN